jgi:glyceraldehyde 3-phosphate dehydrogenase
VADLKQDVALEKVSQALLSASLGALKGIMDCSQEELVSMDFKGYPASSIIDAPSTMVIGGNMVKVVAWYDNEWGYSCRLGDLAAFVAKKGL